LSQGASQPAASDKSALIGSLGGVLGALFCAILIYYGYTQYKDRQTEQENDANLSPYERWMRHQEKGCNDRNSTGLAVNGMNGVNGYNSRNSEQNLSYDNMYRSSSGGNVSTNTNQGFNGNDTTNSNGGYNMNMAGMASQWFGGGQQAPPRESLGDDHMDMTDIYGRNSTGRGSTGMAPGRFSQGAPQGNGPNFALGEFRGSMGNPMNANQGVMGYPQQQKYQEDYKEGDYDYPLHTYPNTMNNSTHNPMMGGERAPSPRNSFGGSPMGASPLRQGPRRPSMRDRRMSAGSAQQRQQYDQYQ
jgi:hypothetical protein